MIEFFNTLDPSADKFLFQTFAANKGQYNLTRTLYGRFEDYEQDLIKLNQQGAEIYVTVNKTKGNRRRKEDFLYARAIWQEDDTGTDKLPPIEPHIVVETSPGHFHRYWLHEPQADIPKWERAQLQMVRLFDSDPGARDIARVLRIPGFTNKKRQCPVKLISINNRPLYSWQEIEQALSLSSLGGADQPGAAPLDECNVNDTVTKTLHYNESGAIPPEGQPQSGVEPQSGMLDDYIAQIQAGEHLHTPLRAIMMINANKGFDRAYNKVVCSGLVNMCPDKDRVRKAQQDLDAMLDATYRKLDEEIEVRPAELTPKEKPTPRLVPPPGLFGELVQAAHEFMVIPNYTVATMTALSLVAGIAGRRYNISTSGLNLYTTVMMPTGGGKDSIRKFCQRILMHESLLGTTGLSFLGAQNYTGPKALLADLQAKPSMLCVMTEAGLLYRTDSGDKNGLTRIILQAYTSSGKYEFIEAERYSSEQDSIPRVVAPALTILNEATPITMLTELKKRESINTGELPRMFIFNIDGPRPDPNPNPHQLSASETVMQTIKHLLTECYKVQNHQIPNVIDLPIPEQFHRFAAECNVKYNSLVEDNPNRAMLYTRAAHKVLKVAALVHIFNHATDISSLGGQLPANQAAKQAYGPFPQGEASPALASNSAETKSGANPNPALITSAEWDWARSLFEYEMQCLNSMLLDEDPFAEVANKAVQVIHKLLTGGYTISKNKQKYIRPELTERGIFTEATFKQAATNIAVIRRAGTSAKYGSPQSGAIVALRYLEREGYIRKISSVRFDGRLKSQLWQVTQAFKMAIEWIDS